MNLEFSLLRCLAVFRLQLLAREVRSQKKMRGEPIGDSESAGSTGIKSPRRPI